jgi:hypothetical protein
MALHKVGEVEQRLRRSSSSCDSTQLGAGRKGRFISCMHNTGLKLTCPRLPSLQRCRRYCHRHRRRQRNTTSHPRKRKHCTSPAVQAAVFTSKVLALQPVVAASDSEYHVIYSFQRPHRLHIFLSRQDSSLALDGRKDPHRCQGQRAPLSGGKTKAAVGTGVPRSTDGTGTELRSPTRLDPRARSGNHADERVGRAAPYHCAGRLVQLYSMPALDCRQGAPLLPAQRDAPPAYCNPKH